MRAEARPRHHALEPNQRQLLDLLRAQGLEGRRVLEVGCGRAPLHSLLLEQGAASVVGVELMPSLLARARERARALGLEQRVTYLEGDFVALAGRLEPADVTVLDKVVHCYPEPERLVRLSADRTRAVYALTYPRDRLWLRVLFRAGAVVMRRLPIPWWPRFTPPETVRGWLREAGFERAGHAATRIFHTEVWVRRSAG